MHYVLKTLLATILFAYTNNTGFSQELDTIHHSEIKCLAHNIYYESRGESFLGKIAVGSVTLNRVSNPHYPNTICGVTYQRVKGTCQFSWVCNKRKAPKPNVYREAEKVAIIVYNGYTKDPTNGATHFHSIKVNPSWAAKSQKTAQIGKHVFYKAHNAKT